MSFQKIKFETERHSRFEAFWKMDQPLDYLSITGQPLFLKNYADQSTQLITTENGIGISWLLLGVHGSRRKDYERKLLPWKGNLQLMNSLQDIMWVDQLLLLFQDWIRERLQGQTQLVNIGNFLWNSSSGCLLAVKYLSCWLQVTDDINFGNQCWISFPSQD